MGQFIVTNSGINSFTQIGLGIVAYSTLTVRLFTNPTAVNYSITTTSITECALSGYAGVALTPANWSGSTSSDVSSYFYQPLVYTFHSYSGSPVTIQGVYITNASNVTVAVKLLDTLYTVPLSGGQLVVSLTDMLQNTP